MAQATGLSPRRAYHLDASTVLVGDVLAGARGRAAESRNGAKRLLNTSLSAQMTYKAVLFGQTSNAAGGYLIQVAHVAPGGGLPADNSANWVTIAALEASGIGSTEVSLSGAAIHKLAKTAASLTTDNPRPIAVRATAGTKSIDASGNVTAGNGVLAPVGTLTLTLQPDA